MVSSDDVQGQGVRRKAPVTTWCWQTGARDLRRRWTYNAAMDQRRTREGYLYALAAYGWWGLVPLYFKALGEVPALELLAHRIVWSLVLLAALVAWFGRWQELRRCWTHAGLILGFVATALLVGVNWYIFIYSVEQREVWQASLGYYINPLVSVVLGLVFLRERLRRVQQLAVLLAAGGVVYLIYDTQRVLWIPLTLAGAFGLYGLVRKRLGVDGLVGLSVETILLAPFALGYLVCLQAKGQHSLGQQDLGHDALILCSGIITALPLLWFGQATQRLPLSSLGFMQYLSPTIQMILAVTVFEEQGPPLAGLVLIWIALVLFTVDSVRRLRQTEVLAC